MENKFSIEQLREKLADSSEDNSLRKDLEDLIASDIESEKDKEELMTKGYSVLEQLEKGHVENYEMFDDFDEFLNYLSEVIYNEVV